MVVVSYSGKEINAKLVYYGPGLSGKTTNLEFIYQSVPQTSRGKMVQMKTRTERTLFFDFLPVDLGQLGGFKTRFLLYTVPGQVYYNATRKLVLRGVDAVVFVADSGKGKMKENIESLQNLRDNLKEYDLDLDKLPWVIQYNKRDLPEVYTLEELEKELNPTGVPSFEAVASTGEGVFETFRGIGKVVLQKLSREVKLEERPTRTIETATSAEPRPSSRSSATMPSPMASSAPKPAEAAAAPAEPPAPAAETPVEATPVAEAPAARMSGTFAAPTFPPKGEPAAEPIPAPTAEAPKNEPTAPESPKVDEPVHARQPEPAANRWSAPATASTPAPATPAEAENSPGFFSRIFGRGKRKEDEGTLTETRVARIDIPAHGGPRSDGPVLIEKRVQVPITLSAQEVLRGATLRLVLEIQVEAQADERVDAA